MTSTPGGEDVEGHTRRLCVCTRIHQNNADRAVNLTTVREFFDTALQYADCVAVAVGPSPAISPSNQETLLQSITRVAREAEEAHSSSAHKGRYGERMEGERGVFTDVFEVTPWGKFTPALNALVAFSARDGADLVMFQSLETTVTKDDVLEMESHLKVEDLVVGAALTGHVFKEGEAVELTGVTTPWNTLAIWDAVKLAKVGFLGVAEGLIADVPAGVEEVTAIATIQALMGVQHAQAKLIRLPQVQWQTTWEDEGRRQWHESKMASKVERAEKQMVALGVSRGLVHHLP